MAQVDYTPEQLSRNRLSIGLTVAIAVGVVMISGTLQGWSIGAFVTVLVVIALCTWPVWKLFASSTAKRHEQAPGRVAWPYLSKKKFEEIQGQWKDL